MDQGSPTSSLSLALSLFSFRLATLARCSGSLPYLLPPSPLRLSKVGGSRGPRLVITGKGMAAPLHV